MTRRARWRPAARALAVGLGLSLAAAGCASTHATTATTTGRSRLPWTPVRLTGAPSVDTGAWGATATAPCAGTDPSGCMLPFPNDYYTGPDASTPTGRRVSFPTGALPTASGRAPVDPAPWEDNDGFSPGSVLLTHIPGLSLSRSDVATIGDMGASLASDATVVLLDTDTRQRWPTWAELDADDPNPATQLLMIHPTQDLAEGQHYVVALRNLVDAAGSAIHPSAAFAAVLAGAPAPEVTAAYANHLRGDVQALQGAGVGSSGLDLVWDFTVESERNLTAPELAMRDKAFAELGAGVPEYTITKVVDDPEDNPAIAREISGTFAAPSFLDMPGGPDGSVLNLGSDGLPAQLPGNMQIEPFDCEIPKAASTARPAHVGVYGHGLFNTSVEVDQSAIPQFSNVYDYAFCGTNWLGLSGNDKSMAVSVVSDIAGFPTLVDHLMQSLIDAQFLGRLLDDPSGFAAAAAFRSGGKPLINPRSGLVYDGNSEGGIMGGAFIALSTDVHRAVLGVPGMDYAVLLARSADFAPFQGLLNSAYPSRATQQLGYDIMQMLWDRGETEGYVEQMTGGLPGTPHHQVLLGEAFGDHQVANIVTETEARTIGAAIHTPALADGRSNEGQPFWDLAPLRPGSGGPALFVWDSGVPAPPTADVPPTSGPDPHDTIPRTLKPFWSQMNAFFTTGVVTDPCGNDPCTAPTPVGGA